jgi:hypothetical protein
MFQGPITLYKCASSLNDSFKICATTSKVISKCVLALVQLSFGFHAGSLDVGDAPASEYTNYIHKPKT